MKPKHTPNNRPLVLASLASCLAVLGLTAGLLTSACAHDNRGNLAQTGQGQNPAGDMPPPGGFGGPGGQGGTPPEGTPPDGFGAPGGAVSNHTNANGPGGTPPNGQGPGQAAQATIRATLTVSGETRTESGKTYTASATDTSVAWVTRNGTLNLTDTSLTKTGKTSNEDKSNFAGQNAVALASDGGHLVLNKSRIYSDGDGANAVVATGRTTVVDIADLEIRTKADSSRGLHATWGGTINATKVTIDTAGEHCAALATDRGEGTVNASQIKARTAGAGSPGIYSTGNIAVRDSTFVATGSEAAVIEGRNSITLVDSSISGAKLWGVMLYQSFSGDAGLGTCVFKMTRGSLSAATGPLFYATNTSAVVELEGVVLQKGSDQLVSAATGRWGKAGNNGGKLDFTARKQVLEGRVEADAISSIKLTLLQGSSLKGSVSNASLSLDATSTWTVTADSSLETLAPSGTSGETMLGNIQSNGFRVSYNASLAANAWLGHKTWQLPGGGSLVPRS